MAPALAPLLAIDDLVLACELALEPGERGTRSGVPTASVLPSSSRIRVPLVLGLAFAHLAFAFELNVPVLIFVLASPRPRLRAQASLALALILAFEPASPDPFAALVLVLEDLVFAFERVSSSILLSLPLDNLVHACKLDPTTFVFDLVVVLAESSHASSPMSERVKRVEEPSSSSSARRADETVDDEAEDEQGGQDGGEDNGPNTDCRADAVAFAPLGVDVDVDVAEIGDSS
ncbi:hypothetical protein K525DRAFT_274474 [Schizophyllum commune Loenen D]|nr:hypothetical protein K525DRAFT_274474 [Schizophyllum commune Loenen D]